MKYRIQNIKKVNVARGGEESHARLSEFAVTYLHGHVILHADRYDKGNV